MPLVFSIVAVALVVALGLVFWSRGDRSAPTPNDASLEPLWRVGRNDTGPSALALLAALKGVTVDVARARELCGTTEKGTNLLQLTKAAEQLGFATRAAKAPSWDVLEDAFAKTGPLIAHVELDLGWGKVGQFVVVTAMPKDGIDYVETSVGPCHATRAEFELVWTHNIVLEVRGQ